MKLTELNARLLKRSVVEKTWIRRKEDGTDEEISGPREVYNYVNELADADGIMFLCPLCFAKNGGEIGTHAVICWFVGKVSDDVEPKPGRWIPSGTGLNDMTFVSGDPPRAVSVLLSGGCNWHGFVTNGEAQ